MTLNPSNGLNPISQLLNQFINELLDDHTFTQIAQQLGMSREGLRLALRQDKQVASFKVGTLLTLTQTFPITIRISQGRCQAFRWDKIESNYKNKITNEKKRREDGR